MGAKRGTPSEIVQEFFMGVFNDGNLSLVDELIAPGYTFNGDLQAPADLKAWVTGLRSTFPDLRFTINDLLAQGQKVAIRWTLVGTDATTKIKMTTSGTNIITLDGGRALSNWQNGGTPADLHPLGGSTPA